MSKNTGTSELINYFDLGANGDVGIAGSLDINTILQAGGDTDKFLVSDTGIIKYRTGAQLLSDIGAQGALTNPVTGTGTSGTIPIFTGSTTLGDSIIQANATQVNIVGNGSQLLFDSLGESKTGGIQYVNDFTLQINNSRGTGSVIYLGNENLDFHTNTSSNPDPRLRITDGGNILVGTTSDNGARLQVSGGGTVSGIFAIGTESTGKIELNQNTGNPNIEIFGGAGSNSVGGSAYYRLRDQTNLQSLLLQINASGGLDFWYQYGGTFYNRATVSSTGAATFSSSVTANNNIFLANDGTYGSNYITLGFGGTSNGSNRIFAGTSSSVDGIFIASATGRPISFRAGGGTTDHLTIASTGAATFSSSVTAASLNTNRISSTTSNPLIWNTAGVSDWFLGSSPLGNSTSDLSLYSYGTSSVVLNIVRSTGAATFSSSATVSGSFQSSGTTPYWQFQSTGAGGTGYLGFGASLISGSAATDFILRSDNVLKFAVGNSNSMVINSTGNVGIGTTSPTNLITLQKLGSVSTTPGIDFRGTLSLGGVYDDLDYNSGRIYGTFDSSVYASARVTIATPTGVGTFQDVLTVKDTNVGIGTISPGWMLEVNKDTASSSFGQYPAISVNNPNASGYGGYWFYQGATFKAGIEYFNSTNTLSFYANSGNRMQITASGNVLIGTTTDNGTRLRISGTAHIPVLTHEPTYHGVKILVYGPVTSVNIDLPTEFPLMGLVGGNVWTIFGKYCGFDGGGVEAREFVIARNSSGTWAAANYGPQSQTNASLQSVTGSGSNITINVDSGSYFTVELTVMIR